MRVDFVIKAGARAPHLAALLEDSNGVVDLTGASVGFRMRRLSDGSEKVNAGAQIVAESSAELSSADAPNVVYEWGDSDTDTPGIYEAEWVVTYEDGSKERFPQDPTRPFIVVEVQRAL